LLGEEEERAVLEELRTGELSYGESAGVVAKLELEFARMHDVPFALTTSSGTAALHAAYFALDLDHGDEVLAPTYTHLGTVLPMLHVGLVPVLCDVDEHTGNIDPSDAEVRISPRTRAIVVTHQYGHVCDMDAIAALAARHDLRVVEDCAHALGSTYNGRVAGTFGDVACFSLQAHKVVPAGEGGVLLTRDATVFERATLLAHFRRATPATGARLAPFTGTGYGLKNRLHPLGAALALVGLRRLPERIRQRRENLEYFGDRARSITGVRPLPTAPGVDRGGYFRYLLRYSAAELHGVPIGRYVDALRAEGVCEVALGNLAKPLHLTALLQTLDDGMHRSGWPRRGAHVNVEHVYRPGNFPAAERFSEETLQFPAFTEPSRHVIDAYCEAMAKVARCAEDLLPHGTDG
jgi:perosamine synthetase